ncbi:MAG: PilZ domain-containing protein [Deltaproteobacteria bacterium]|nr:PilZ domain-containing protein [Deltaproteobacteria bacterium]MBI4794412.1 PilZ domain-containing protein [Deltaproteobacteria bacterium]
MSERRRHNRLVLTLPLRYHDGSGDGGEEQGGLGILKNISLGGLYFECPPPVNIKQGQILQFTIAASLPSLDFLGTSNLAARGEVLRLDHLLGADRACGVAVRFLEELSFSNS